MGRKVGKKFYFKKKCTYLQIYIFTKDWQWLRRRRKKKDMKKKKKSSIEQVVSKIEKSFWHPIKF